MQILQGFINNTLRQITKENSDLKMLLKLVPHFSPAERQETTPKTELLCPAKKEAHDKHVPILAKTVNLTLC